MLDSMEIVMAVAWHCAGGDASWLERALATAGDAAGLPFRTAYAAVTRHLGPAAHQPVAPPVELASVARPHWVASDWVRAALLLQALSQSAADQHAGIVQRLLEGGEIGETCSLLRTLGLLPEPARFLDSSLFGCRSSSSRVVEAIACENASPARYLPEPSFNQMVLKAIFMDLPVRRIEGLAARVTPELARMVRGYASERRAAGRSVPPDVDYVLQGARE
jgi:hypothetical protein